MARPTTATLRVLGLMVAVAAVGCGPRHRLRRARRPSPPSHLAKRVALPTAPWRIDEDETSSQRGTGPTDSTMTAVVGARVLTGGGEIFDPGHVVMAGGKILTVGAGVPPAALRVTTTIDARGKTVTPGLIDTHSHMGVYPIPRARAHDDGNEATHPTTPDVRVVDGFWPQDPAIERAVAGGVTTLQVLPGSANLIGGRALTIKLRASSGGGRAMQFRGAPSGLKMACGENPKRVYGSRKSRPSTRMGNLAVQRAAFWDAKQLIADWDRYIAEETRRLARERDDPPVSRAEEARQQRACRTGASSKKRCKSAASKWPSRRPLPGKPPPRNLALESLAGALEGSVLVHIHCYRADDMMSMMALADEVGLPIRSFHHALEAYKIRDILAMRRIAVSTWADWWGFKLEAYDGIEQNLGLVAESHGIAVVHSDSREGIRRLNQEAAKAWYAARRSGIDIDESEALRWITANPAWALGIERQVGTLKPGKDADVVVWSGSPFSVYTVAERVFVDGRQRYLRGGDGSPESDFELTGEHALPADPKEAPPK